jgi:hypothetical protein
MECNVQLQLSAKSVGLFEAFYNSIKPIPLLYYSVVVAESGKLPDGTTELPFEFPLEALQGKTFFLLLFRMLLSSSNAQYDLRTTIV